MKRTAIGGGAYVDAGKPPRYWERPRGRTWRLMRGVTTRRAAIRLASARDPHIIGRKFANLAQLYIDARCPDGKLKPRPPDFASGEIARVKTLIEYFGGQPLDKVGGDGIAVIPEYHAWRIARIPQPRRRDQNGFGGRTVDKDLQTLSNLFRYALASKLFPFNPFSKGRPRYQTAGFIRHSRERAPKTADAIHDLAGKLFDTVLTETTGWFCFFAMFSSCRISELLRLRLDAPDRDHPGYIEWSTKPGDDPLGILHLGDKKHGGGRCKNGLNPEIIIGPEFAAMLRCFQRWHAARYPDCKSFFPNRTGDGPISRRLVHRHIEVACQQLKLAPVTPHGFRSFYVTKRRSDGASDTVIAGELGDKTVALMQTTYGDRPKSWMGGEALAWLPKERLPAWERWSDAAAKIIQIH